MQCHGNTSDKPERMIISWKTVSFWIYRTLSRFDVPRKVDAMFLPGGSHPEQPEYAAAYHEGYAPLIIPSGGVSVKQDKWPGVRSKADVYNGDYQSDCEFFTDVLVKTAFRRLRLLRRQVRTYTGQCLLVTKSCR